MSEEKMRPIDPQRETECDCDPMYSHRCPKCGGRGWVPTPAADAGPRQSFRHHNGEIDFPNGDRVRWANGWWMADRKGGDTSKHKTPRDAEAALNPNLECGHSRWDARQDCLVCLNEAVAVLNEMVKARRIAETASQPVPQEAAPRRNLETAESKLAENGIVWEEGKGYVFDGKE